jgi:hypothetical protein
MRAYLRLPSYRETGPLVALASVLVAASWIAAPPALAWGTHHAGTPAGACAQNARAGLQSCNHSVLEELWGDVAVCAFDADWADKKECLVDAFSAPSEKRGECRDVYEARNELCDLTDPGPYDPDFDPASFDTDFTALTNPNPYLPLAIGDRWRYENEDETNVVEVTAATKQIEGVTCITVHDAVSADGVVTEDTDDWEAQAKDGSVWYCGESSRTYEVFDGDNPMTPELIDVEGSWKTGRDDAKPGVLMQAAPTPGTTYRQEYLFDEAEDAATVLSNAYSYGNGEGLDDFVPQALADHFCASGDCVVTKDFASIEPGLFERKYYAPGVGLFLGVEDGVITPLVECNFHPLCTGIPDVSAP